MIVLWLIYQKLCQNQIKPLHSRRSTNYTLCNPCRKWSVATRNHWHSFSGKSNCPPHQRHKYYCWNSRCYGGTWHKAFDSIWWISYSQGSASLRLWSLHCCHVLPELSLRSKISRWLSLPQLREGTWWGGRSTGRWWRRITLSNLSCRSLRILQIRRYMNPRTQLRAWCISSDLNLQFSPICSYLLSSARSFRGHHW